MRIYAPTYIPHEAPLSSKLHMYMALKYYYSVWSVNINQTFSTHTYIKVCFYNDDDDTG